MAALYLGALGVVYGDIGTSPLYAIRESLHEAHHGEASYAVTTAEAMGVLSLASWVLILVIALKYLTFVLRADNKGEGGVLALVALLVPEEGRAAKRPLGYVLLLGLFATALTLADGMITPAISVLSAVEGGIEKTAPDWHAAVIPATLVIIGGLFLIQKHGTARIGRLFGPMMLVWFASLIAVAVPWIIKEPGVLSAISPHHAVSLILQAPLKAGWILAAVVLVVTGGEALYADMGHFGRRPIRVMWYTVVMPGLLINYYGQVAAVLHDPAHAENPFWAIVPDWFGIPMLIIATAATIIASQAMISGAFSLARQAVQLGYCPRLQIVHTSASMIGQIYVPFVNRLLMIGCIALVLVFQKSTNLTAMYGMAVTGTMVITSILLLKLSREQWGWPLWKTTVLGVVILAVDISLFCSSLTKFTHGGWVALAVGVGVFTVMAVWVQGRAVLAKPIFAVSLPLPLFLKDIQKQRPPRVPGTAVFMASRPDVVPLALMHHLKHNRVLHERVVLLAVQTRAQPKVQERERLSVTDVGQGFWEVKMEYGFMENPDVPASLLACEPLGLKLDPGQASYYLGRVSLKLTRRRPMWRWAKSLFGFLYHNERAATEFFNLPANRVVELGRQLEM